MAGNGSGAAGAARWIAIVGGGLVAVTMIVLLALMLGTLNDTSAKLTVANERLDDANERIAGLRSQLEPTTERAPRVLERTRRFFRTADDPLRVTEETLPNVEGALLALTSEALPVLAELRRAGVADTLAGVDALVATVLHVARRHEVGPTVDALRSTLVRLDRLDLLRELDRRLDALGEIERATERTRTGLRDSLVVQCRILDHLRSIDAKTGGEVPPDAGAERSTETCRELEREADRR